MKYASITANCITFSPWRQGIFVGSKRTIIIQSQAMETSKTGFWNERKEMLKVRFPSISDDDLHFHDGKEKEMMEMLSYKLGKSEDELRRIVNTLKQQ